MNQQITLNEVEALNRNVPIPLYYQLKQFILSNIKNGDWPVSYQIPSEQQFCEKFGISRPTVRQAIGELTTEGHLTRKDRKVTVSKPKMDASFFNKLQSFNEEMRAKNLRPSTRVLSFGVRACEEAQNKLGLSESERCIYLERLRFADGEPVVWVETYLPYDLMEGLMSVDFENASLYETIESKYGIMISHVNRMIEATLAGARDAEVLSIKKGNPICFVKTTAYDQNESPIEFSIARYRGDKSQFMITISR